MITTLLVLSLRGGAAVLLVLGLDRLTAPSWSARSRRLWWLLLPLVFLLPVELPALSFPTSPAPAEVSSKHGNVSLPWTQWPASAATALPEASVPWLILLWIAGVIASALAIVVPTVRVHLRWSHARLCTDPRLLNLLEDARACAGVTAPFGLILSDDLATPALLGWLRPRLLLPSALAEAGREDALRAVFLHELAHFKAGDLPVNWLFALVRTVHWFNPLAWLAGAAWARFREEAADETAIRWLGQTDSARHYGEILLDLLDDHRTASLPTGALAMAESYPTLQRRIRMIRHYPAKSPRTAAALFLTLALAALAVFIPFRAVADDSPDSAKKDAEAAMEKWLGEIDAGKYAASWTDAAKSFQTALPSEKWVGALDGVRTPLGKLLDRKLTSALYQTEIPLPGGKTLKGQYVIAQYDSSFENLKYARETVTFEREADGTWRASGYYIKPR
jgi:beta-lactamase regulating signal transducer with metallopeptidase domain